MKVLLILVFLTSCVMLKSSDEMAQALSPSKQKQKIAFLEKKLKRAEKEEKKVKEEIDRLTAAVKEAQLTLIQRQIDEYQEKIHKKGNVALAEPPTLFLQEREILHQMVLDGPSTHAFEAQKVLDQILEMITNLSDH